MSETERPVGAEPKPAAANAAMEDGLKAMAAKYGLSADALLSGARKGAAEGVQRGLERGTRSGVEQGIAEALAERARNKPRRRLWLRIPCLLLGLFLLLGSIGGFSKGETLAAVVVLMLGLGLVGVFFVMRPKSPA